MQFEICIYDDELIIAMDLKQQIEKLGYKPTIIKGNEKNLLKYIKENTPHLLILDVKLKGEMNGYKLAKIIMKDHSIPILFITGSGSGEFKQNFITNKNTLFLKKPFEEKALSDSIKNLLQLQNPMLS